MTIDFAEINELDRLILSTFLFQFFRVIYPYYKREQLLVFRSNTYSLHHQHSACTQPVACSGHDCPSNKIKCRPTYLSSVIPGYLN